MGRFVIWRRFRASLMTRGWAVLLGFGRLVGGWALLDADRSSALRDWGFAGFREGR
ncbi:hypothetical protein VDG1235_1535 [Verrucomicrobiia bacterium DG1235]|nr:hypothetical protein VDG1235_1535 [Verrucomicrobiae bacterium DG1235]